jgi:hypothetical protein
VAEAEEVARTILAVDGRPQTGVIRIAQRTTVSASAALNARQPP